MPFTLLLPGALLPAGLAAELQRHAQAPALQRMLARGTVRRTVHDPFAARCTAAEAWLAQAFGLGSALPRAHCLAWAADAATAALAAGPLWCAELGHLHLATDHLVLADPHHAAPRPGESQALLDSARPLLEEAGIGIRQPEARLWFLQLPADWELRTATPDCARGRNVEAWMPTGSHAGAWRRVLNGVQMAWHAHPVNEARMQEGLPPINSIWLHGGTAGTPRTAFAAAAGGDDALHGLARWAGMPHAPALPAEPAEGLLAVDDRLLQAGAREDWGAWLEAMQDIDRKLLQPALSRSSQLGGVHLVLAGEAEWLSVQTRASDAWLFWRRGPGWNALAEQAA
jgi:hypothetical protein